MMQNRIYIGADGRPMYDQPLVNWDGKVVTEYDEHIIWKSKNFNPDMNHAIYTDRMWEADGVRYYAAVRTIWPEFPQRQLFHDITPEQAGLLLNLYFGYEVELTAILKGTHRMNGYPYWVFGYSKVENATTNTVTMRTVINNNLIRNPVVEIPKNWRFSTYADAEKDLMVLVNEIMAKFQDDLPGNFRMDTDDDIYNVIQNHIAAIFCDIIPEPIATFDIFGLAESTDKYGGMHWYYRGHHLYQKPSSKRIYCTILPQWWRSSLDAALKCIDELVLSRKIQKG